MSKVENLDITASDKCSLEETIDNITAGLVADWSREDAIVENDVSSIGPVEQCAFRYKKGEEDISIWFKKDGRQLKTTNVVARHANNLPIDRCNSILKEFANANLIGKEKHIIK